MATNGPPGWGTPWFRAAAPLDASLKRDAPAAGRKHLASILPDALPQRLVEAIVERAGLGMQHRAAELSNLQRERLVQEFKQTRIAVSGTLGFKKAEVT